MNENDLNIFVCSIISNDLISVVRLKQFQEETQKDETLKMIIPHIKNDWPNEPGKVPANIRSYYRYRKELCIINRLSPKENRIVVLQTRRQKMETLLHNGHLGIAKIKISD